MKRMLIPFLLLITAIVVLSACGQNDVIVETDAGNITQDELFEEFLRLPDAEAIISTAILNKVLESKYDVSDKDVDARYDELKEEAGENFEMILLMNNLTQEDLKDNLKFDLLYNKAISDGIDITDEAIEKYYEMMQQEVNTAQIILDDEDTANEVKDKLDSGDDFVELVKEYSIDEESANNDGDMGYITVGTDDPRIVETAFSLDIDEVSDPIRTNIGYHIIKTLDKRDLDDIGSLEDNKALIEQLIIDSQVSQEDAERKVYRLIADSNVKINIDEFKHLFATSNPEDDEIGENDDNEDIDPEDEGEES